LEKPKIKTTSTKIVCDKCGKDHYVNFVADGHRKYYCDECLKEMHHSRKKGVVKKLFNKKQNKEVYEFVCDICDNFRRSTYLPKKEKGLIWCRECENKKASEDRKKNRGKIVIAKTLKDS
jgi:CxxC-x17-CxxC domain-containing protein